MRIMRRFVAKKTIIWNRVIWLDWLFAVRTVWFNIFFANYPDHPDGLDCWKGGSPKIMRII